MKNEQKSVAALISGELLCTMAVREALESDLWLVQKVGATQVEKQRHKTSMYRSAWMMGDEAL